MVGINEVVMNDNLSDKENISVPKCYHAHNIIYIYRKQFNSILKQQEIRGWRKKVEEEDSFTFLI